METDWARARNAAGFSVSKSRHELKLLPPHPAPASPLLCPSGPTELPEARQTLAPNHSSLSGTLPLYPSGLPPPPSADVFSRTQSSRTHPGLPHLLAGADLLPHLAPAPRWEPGLGYPPPGPPTHGYPLPTAASLSYLGLAQRSHPSLTSLPEISMSAWGQHLAKPPDGPAPTLGGFCLDNFAHQCQGDRVPCPVLASHVSSWASCWLDTSSENPPASLTKQSMLFSPEDADKALQTANESPDNYFIIHRMNISSKLELTRHPTSDLHEWGSTGPAHCLPLFPSSK